MSKNERVMSCLSSFSKFLLSSKLLESLKRPLRKFFRKDILEHYSSFFNLYLFNFVICSSATRLKHLWNFAPDYLSTIKILWPVYEILIRFVFRIYAFQNQTYWSVCSALVFSAEKETVSKSPPRQVLYRNGFVWRNFFFRNVGISFFY